MQDIEKKLGHPYPEDEQEYSIHLRRAMVLDPLYKMVINEGMSVANAKNRPGLTGDDRFDGLIKHVVSKPKVNADAADGAARTAT